MMKELFKDISKYLPSFAIPAIVGFFTIPIITRLFPPEDYGNYVLVIATVSVSSAIATAWISASIIRFYPAYKLDNRLGELNGTTIKLTIVSVALVCFLIFGILFLNQNYISANLHYLMGIGILIFIFSSCWSVFLTFFRAKREVTGYTSFTIWRSIAGLGFGVALVVIFHYGVEGLLWGSFLSMAVAFPLLGIVVMKKPSFKEGSIHSPMTSEMAKYGFPVAIVNLATWILSLSDRYILEFFRGSYEVGIYSVSYGISEQSIFMIASLFLLASPPIAFNIWETQGIEASKEYVSKLSRYYLLLALPAAVGLSVLAGPTIDVLAAPAYYQGYKIIPFVAFGAFLVGIEHEFVTGLTYYKRTDLLMHCILGAGLLNIVLNLLFIPKYGYMAAAATTFVSYAFLLLLVIFVSRRFFVWEFPFKSLGKITCASTVMGAVVYPMSHSLTSSPLINLILSMCIGMAIYFLMLLLLREFQDDEIRTLRTTIMRVLGRE